MYKYQEEILKKIIEAQKDGKKLVIYYPPRWGKTAIRKRIKDYEDLFSKG